MESQHIIPYDLDNPFPKNTMKQPGKTLSKLEIIQATSSTQSEVLKQKFCQI